MQQSCQRCGKRFNQTGADIYCPGCTEEIAAAAFKTQRSYNKTCVTCGKEFMATDKKQKYCSVSCRSAAYKVPTKPEVGTEKAKIVFEEIKTDPVNHPSHYTRGKIEVIEFIEDQRLSYHLGNVLKYICRAGFKNNEVEDLKKAAWYLNRYIGLIEGGVRDERTTLPHA